MDAALARELIGKPLPASHRAWDADDVILYHLGIGAGTEAPGPRALRYVYERGLEVLPGFAATVAHATGAAIDAISGAAIDRTRAVHGEQEIVLHRPIPAAAEVVTTGRVIEVADLGRSALVRTETETRDAHGGHRLFTTRFGIVVRGAGGFGAGAVGGGADVGAEPAGVPDLTVRIPSSPRQAMLYRLCGDRNPLHVDPEHARAAGFEAPILHGLSTFGSVLRGVVDAALDGEPWRVRAYTARFLGPVFPGETLLVDVWRVGDADAGELRLRAGVVERGTAVLGHARVTVGPLTPPTKG